MSEDWLSPPAIKEAHKVTKRRWSLAILVTIMVGVTTSWFIFEEHTLPRPRALGEVAFLFEVNTQELRAAHRGISPQREVIQDQQRDISPDILNRNTSRSDLSQRSDFPFSAGMNTSPPIPDLKELQRRVETTPPDRPDQRVTARVTPNPVADRPVQTSPISPPVSTQIDIKRQATPQVSVASPSQSSTLNSPHTPTPQTGTVKRPKSAPVKESRANEPHVETTRKKKISSSTKTKRAPLKTLKSPVKSPAKRLTKQATKRPTKRTKRTKRTNKSQQNVMWDQARFTLQVRAFRVEHDAERFLDELDREWPQLSTRILTASSRGKPIYRVLLGAFKNRKEAKDARRDFTRKYGAQHKPFIKALR